MGEGHDAELVIEQRRDHGGLETEDPLHVGGIHPDLNRNEIDDAVDIASGTSNRRGRERRC